MVDQTEPNAFALPGGHIFISRGLLALANNEDELACVIGHEITHAHQRHSAAQQGLAKRGLASGYLKEITAGLYDELLVDGDMQISIRIPETKSLNTDPERRLSKGTVDQIYFAMLLR